MAEDKDQVASQIVKLQRVLDEKEQNLKLSAEIGNTLLQQNNELETKCDELMQDYSKRIEALEQEKYTLQMRLSTKENMEKTQQNELEYQREQLLKEADQERESRQLKHVRTTQQMQAKLDQQQTDLEMATITEEQLKDSIAKQEEMLRSAHEKLTTLKCVMPVDNSEELMMLQHSNNVLKSEVDFLQIELKEHKDKLNQLTFLVANKEHHVETLTTEVDEERQQATSYYNALEKCREEVTDLQVQLDVARMDSMDHKKKGNSLFGEVEDRRKALEKKLISITVQYDAAKEQLAIKKQQIHRLKFQIAGLFHMSGGRVDAAQIERLEQALMERDGEIKFLNGTIAKLECNQNAGSDKQLDDFCKKLREQKGNCHVDADFIDLLNFKLKKANGKIESLTKELQTERMLGMAGSDELKRAEKNLYMSESDANRLRAANIKLTLKLEDLRAKLKIPDPDDSKQKIQQYYIEKIPIDTDKKEEPATLSEPTPTAGETPAAFVSNACHQNFHNQPAQEAGGAVKKLTTISVDTTLNGTSSTNAGLTDDHKTVSHYAAPDTVKEDVQCLVLPKLKRATKKSVTMCETVSTLDEMGQVQETTNLQSGSEKSSVLKRRTVEDGEGGKEDTENGDLLVGPGGRRRPKGRKQHKVIYVGSEPKHECKSQ